MTGVCHSRIAGASEQNWRFAYEPELEEHAFRVSMYAVASHSVMGSEVIPAYRMLNLGEGRFGYPQVVGSPSVRTSEAPPKSRNNRVEVFLQLFHLTFSKSRVTEAGTTFLVVTSSPPRLHRLMRSEEHTS